METIVGRHWHQLPPDEVLELLDADAAKGLDRFEVERRRAHFGPNVITPKSGPGMLTRFLMQFNQPLVYILLAAGVVTVALNEPVDASVIFGVVLLNAIVGFLQEAKAAKALEALARSMVSEATVIRAGNRVRISAADAVPGDIVFLQAGDKVPADMRLIESRDLKIDESAITGESVASEKEIVPLPEDTSLGDRHNMAFASSLVTYGQATGVVVATGDNTEVGRISELLAAVEQTQTPLLRKIARFSQILLYTILALALLTFAAGVLRGKPAVDMFMAAVALAVAAIPEGLPAAMTITLAIGVARMARRRAIIRKLPAVETLGSTTVICSDKTGTLTENQMTVQEIAAADTVFSVTGGGYAPEGRIACADAPGAPRTAAADAVLLAGLLCNDSGIEFKDGRWVVRGDPTEGALITSALKAEMKTGEARAAYPRLDTVPFESEHKYMATLHRTAEGTAAYVKGAVEVLLPRCSGMMAADATATPLDETSVHTRAEGMAARGLRVLAFARRDFGPDKTDLTRDDVRSNLVFLGLQAMMDPPRAEAITAVAACQEAGIRVKMITGDHAVTASAIAAQIGLATPPAAGKSAVLTGRELAQMSDEQLIDAASDTHVFARVSPEQKLRLVQALQARGNVVAMTGDGVNDAPALRQADIGVAMGMAGTEVAKEAADVVLTDDNFASIEAAVEEGRGVFDNLTKFIVWTLPTNLGEGLVILVAILAALEMPILPVQILWVNMTTAIFLGLMLAFEPKEPGIMKRLPRQPDTPILTPMLIQRLGIVGLSMVAGALALFEYELFKGASLAEARTAAVGVFVVVEACYLFNCRSLYRPFWQLGIFSNKWLFSGVAVMAVLQLLFTYVPAMNRLFHSAPLGMDIWAEILLLGVFVFLAVEGEKRLRRQRATAI